MYTSREMRWSAGVLSIAMTLAISCGKDDKNSGGSATGGSGDVDTGGAGGRGTGGTSTGTGGAGGSSTGGSGTGGATSPGADAGSADTGSAIDASGPAVGVERFVGEWDYKSGGAQLSCPGAQPISQTYTPSNYISFNAGAGVAPLILALTGCNLRFDIQGQTAVAQPGQTCALPVGTKPANRQPDAYTYAIEGDQLRETSRWTVTFPGSADPPCTLTSQGTLVRHP